MANIPHIMQLLDQCEAIINTPGSKDIELTFPTALPENNFFPIPKKVEVNVETRNVKYTFDAKQLKKKILKSLRKSGINVVKTKTKRQFN